MKKTILFITTVMVLLFLAGCTIEEHMEDDHHLIEEEPHDHSEITKLYGPGLGPHSLFISLNQFDEKDDIAKQADDLPLTIEQGKTVKINLLAKEVVSEIDDDITYLYWTFNETVPGPFLRVKENDMVEFTLANHHSSSHNHSIDLHAVNGPGGGSTLTQVAPGEEKTFRFKALNPGLYVYHCATHNVPTHIANGMYGLILIEPEEGLSKVDKEFYVMQSEFYTQGNIGEQGYQALSAEKLLNRNPEYIVFNGRPGALVDYPLKAEVGEKVRLYVGNGALAFPSSFHIIGEIFDNVYHEGGTLQNHNVQTTMVPAGGASIVEFTVDTQGTYILVDHALATLDRGAWGLLEVTGKENTAVFEAVSG